MEKKSEMILLHSKSGLEKRELYIRAVNREKGNRDQLLSTGMAYAAQNDMDYWVYEMWVSVWPPT
jgi:hypothetical protein